MTPSTDDRGPNDTAAIDTCRATVDRAALDEYVAERATEQSATRLHDARARYDTVRSDPGARPADLAARWAEVEAAAREHAEALDAASRAATITAIARMQTTPRGTPAAPTLHVTHRTADADGAVEVTVDGDLDTASADVFDESVRRPLEREDVHTVRVDLSGVTFLDSSGLRALVGLRAAAATLRTALVLTGVGDRLRGTLAFAHLDELLLGD